MSGRIDFDAIEAAGSARARELLQAWLPGGKVRGREFICGSINGEPGESFSFNLTTGEFADFAGGEPKGRGVISLRAAILTGRVDKTGRVAAARELEGVLGLNGHARPPGPVPRKAKAKAKPAEDEWSSIFPPPADAGEPATLLDSLHADRIHAYTDASGRVVAYVCRVAEEGEGKDGKPKKRFVPVSYGTLNGRTGWHPKAITGDRPLYRLDDLAARPDAPVLVCEGEKAADAARDLFPGHVVTTWQGGAHAMQLTDWSPLAGRPLVIWPDADDVGRKAAAAILKLLPSTRFVVDTAGLADGYDAADLAIDPAIEDPAAWLTARLRDPADQPLPPELLGYFAPINLDFDPDKLPGRPWLAPPYLMRGQITLLHGPGGAGKSQLYLAWSLALALKRDFGRLRPKQRCRVLLLNFEENAHEQQLRIAAALQYFSGATLADLKGWLIPLAVDAKDPTMFVLDEKGGLKPTDAWRTLLELCDRYRPDVVMPDPLIAINALPESDNTLARRMMQTMRREIANRYDCSLALAHHDNKSGGDNEDDDAKNARGAGDIVNAARIALAVRKMTLGQAEGFDLNPNVRGNHFRLGSVGSKINYAAAQDSEWFERISVPIGIDGEEVVRCLPWEPPPSKLTEDQARDLIEAIGKGTGEGPYSPRLNDGARSLGPILDAAGIETHQAQRRALRELRRMHGVVQAAFRRPGHGTHERQGLRTAGGLPCNCEWQDEDGQSA